jgi:hypothetical protein
MIEWLILPHILCSQGLAREKAGAEKEEEKKRKGRQMNVERGETASMFSAAFSTPLHSHSFKNAGTAKAKQLNKDF